MNIHLTLGPKYSVDTNDIQGILDNADNIRIHWKAYPGGMHVYTDITKDTLIEWYEQYAGGTIHGDFEGLLSEFNKVLKTIGITPVSSSTRKTMSYLEEAFNMADNEWNAGHSGLFESSNFPEIYSYRGTNDKNLKLSYTAMQAWLMAMCLSELVPSSDPTSNNQTKLYQRAYNLGGGRKVALYDNYSLKGDVMIARLVAGVVYARNRSYYTFSDMDSMRSEIGGSSITLSDWTDMGYRSVSSIGYNVAANSIFPSAPGPFVTEYSSKTHPSEQPSSQFYGSSGNPDNWYDDNYKIDVAIDNEVTSKYNLAAKDDYLARTVQAIADDSESTRHQLAEKVYYQYSTGGTTYIPEANKYVPNPRFTFKAATSSTTGNAGYFTGTFNSEVTGIDLSDKITDSNGNDTVLKKFMDGVRTVGSKGRQQLFDAQMGRRRPSTGLNVSSPRILQKDDTSNEYRKNWLDDTSIARLVGSGTRYDSQGGAHSWYIDRNGNGKWDDAQGTTPYEPYVNDPWTFSGDNLYPGPGTYTYPSGHSAGVFSQALFLIQMLPDRADKILKAAYAYSVNRTIVRAHWNSDTIYGRVVGTMMVPVLNAVKSFQSIYKDAYSVVTGGGGGGTDDEILARVYLACYEAQGGTLPSAEARVDHQPTPDNPGLIIFKIVNKSTSNRYLCNGVFRVNTEDGTTYMAHFREPSNTTNGAHLYYWDETNFVLEPGETITSEVPIKRTYLGEIQQLDFSKKFKIDDNTNGYVLYHSAFSSTEGDYLLHNKPYFSIISSSLRVYPSMADYNAKTNEITGSERGKISLGRVYEVALTEANNYMLPVGEDKSAYRMYAAHDSTTSVERILDPLRLVEWKDYEPPTPTPDPDPPTPPTPTGDDSYAEYTGGNGIRFILHNNSGVEARFSGAVVLNLSKNPNDWDNSTQAKAHIYGLTLDYKTNEIIIPSGGTFESPEVTAIEGIYMPAVDFTDGSWYLMNSMTGVAGHPVFLYTREYSRSRKEVSGSNHMYAATPTVNTKLQRGYTYHLNVNWVNPGAMLANASLTEQDFLNNHTESYAILAEGKTSLG